MKKYWKAASLFCGASISLLMGSCVNDDYDLSEDVDMTVQVGGDLTLPTSHTANLAIRDILDIEEDEIVQLREIAPGDSVYYVVKEADNPSDFSFEIDRVNVEDPEVETFSMGFEIPELAVLIKDAMGEAKLNEIRSNLALIGKTLDDLKTDLSLLDLIFTPEELAEVRISDPIALEEGFDIFNFDFDIPEEVVALDSVWFDQKDLLRTDVYLTTDLYAGELGLHKVVAKFPGELKHDNITEGGAWLGHIVEETVDGKLTRTHRFLLPDNIWLDRYNRDHLFMEFVAMDMDYDKNTAATPGVMNMESKVQLDGSVDIRGTLKDFVLLAGNSYKLMVDDIHMSAPTIASVNAIVDPVINDENTTIDLDDVPEFLTEDEGRFILKEPRINLSVTSNVPVDVDCWGVLTALKGGETINGTPMLVGEEGNRLSLTGNSTTRWCLWDGVEPAETDYRKYYVPGLSNLILQMPEKIDMTFSARADQKYYRIELGRNYSVSVDYAVESPLALAAGSQVVYTETFEDWNSDIEDYDVKGLKLTAVLELDERLPFDEIDLTIEPLDVDGNIIPGIKVSSLAGVKNGEQIELTLTSEKGALRELDGLSLKATAKVTRSDAEPLRATNSVRLTDISVGIVGGIVADLN